MQEECGDVDRRLMLMQEEDCREEVEGLANVATMIEIMLNIKYFFNEISESMDFLCRLAQGQKCARQLL
jgi:hypothetical protein